MRTLRPGLATPLVIAHRGASHSHPENTLAAFEAAIAFGCDAIELDVQLSRDGVAMVYHDRTLSSIGGGRRYVSSLTSSELDALDAGDGQPPPTLADTLSRFGGSTHLILELKVRRRDRQSERHRLLAEAVGRELASLPEKVRRECSLLSFDREVLELAANTSGEHDRPSCGFNTHASRWSRHLGEQLKGLTFISCDIRTVTPSLVRHAQSRGFVALVYTVDTERAFARARAVGAEGIMSNKPDWLRRRLSEDLAAGEDEPTDTAR